MFKRKAKPNQYEFNENDETYKKKARTKQTFDKKQAEREKNANERAEATSKVNVNMLS